MTERARIVILGAGFGGLELATSLGAEHGDAVDITLIDSNDGFWFGYSKLDVMFHGASLESQKLPYSALSQPGVTFRQETVTAIDPETRTVTTSDNSYSCDYLVIALGADYDVAATPGLAESGGEFYSFSGSENVVPLIDSFTSGHAVVGICDAPYKCPPAPSETALLLHDHLVAKGVRDQCTITLTTPLPSPVPPSPETSAALLEAFAERGIECKTGVRVSSIDNDGKRVHFDDGSELPCDLFLGVPKHQAPRVVLESGMCEGGYIPVDGRTLKTAYEGVYAVGDVATVGTPKAGVFAEKQARIVAASIGADLRGAASDERYDGKGSCWIEFGNDRVARIDVDFFSHEKPTGVFSPPSLELVAEKEHFGASRRERWFGLTEALTGR